MKAGPWRSDGDMIEDTCSSKLSNSFSMHIETIIATVDTYRKGGLGPLHPLVKGIATRWVLLCYNYNFYTIPN